MLCYQSLDANIMTHLNSLPNDMLEVGCSTFEATHKLCRWRKCQSFANKFVNKSCSAKDRLDENERKETLNKSKVFEHDKVQSILPNYD